MTYRGRMTQGVVVLDGDKPADGTSVYVMPVSEVNALPQSVANHPALGIWKDRTDLPDDAVEAAKVLRERLMRRSDE